MHEFRIIALVRQRGAIGAAYDQEFTVQANSPDHAMDVWFDSHSDEWELMHFVTIKPAP